MVLVFREENRLVPWIATRVGTYSALIEVPYEWSPVGDRASGTLRLAGKGLVPDHSSRTQKAVYAQPVDDGAKDRGRWSEVGSGLVDPT